MLRKLLHCCKLVLLCMLFGQCQKCSQPIYEDAAKWVPVWQEAHPTSITLPEGLDLKKGITCYVAVDNATYFLNPTGECWKFTQTATGPAYKAIDNFPDAEESSVLFAFVAGPTPETRVLHAGVVTDDTILLHCYTPAEGWQHIDDFDLSHYGIHHVSDPYVAACAIRDVDDGEQQGLIALQTDPNKNLTMLVYEPSFKALENDASWHYNYPDRKPIAALELAPNKAMLVYKDKSDSLGVRVFTREKESVSVAISINDTNPTDNITRAALFSLSATEHTLRRALLVLHRKKQDPEEHIRPSFYILQDSLMIPASELPKEASKQKEQEKQQKDADIDNEENDTESVLVDHKDSLVLPFGNQVYFITQNSKGELVYYVVALGAPEESEE